MTTVAVTGASGYLGQILLDGLSRHPTIGRVVGIDRVEPKETTRNLEFYRLDVRSPDLPRVLSGADVLVHLAFTVAGEDTEMEDVNVGGTRLVFEAAAYAGVRKVVYVSSTMAYGAHPDNDFPLTEESPLRPARDLPHSNHNAQGEEIVRAFNATHPELRTTTLRLSPVIGRTLAGSGRRFVESPYAFAIRGYEAPGQALHESDAGRAMVVAAVTDLEGVYNVCPDDWVPSTDVGEILGQRRVELDRDGAERAMQRMVRLKLGDIPPGIQPFLMYPWVASNEKLRATGFAFEHTTAEALREGAESRQGWVTVAGVRFKPRRLLVVGGTIGAVVLGGAMNRKRARRALG